MSLVDTIIGDVEKVEAGAPSVISFIESLYSEVKQIEGSVMPFFDELLSKKTEVAAATQSPPATDTQSGAQAAS